MAFFGGLSGWSGSSWSPWSGLGSDPDSESDTVTTTAQVVQTSTSTPSPTTATATVVQQVTTTAVSVVTASTTASTPNAVTVTQTSKAASSAIPSTIAQNNAQTSQQQQQASQVSQVGSSSIASAQSSSSTSRPSSSATTSSSSTNSTENVGDIPDDWTYFGCVPNNNGMPALNTTYATSDELTPVLCITACAASQYHYAGLQNGNACFCGSTMTTPSMSSSSSSSSCNMNCTGDPSGSSKCGGSSSMSFYHLRSIDPNSSSYPNSSSTSTGLDSQYGDSGSGTVVVSLPELTGTLMEYDDPRFRSGKDGVVFGEMFKVSSASSRYSPDPDTKLEGLASLILLGWVGLRILR